MHKIILVTGGSGFIGSVTCRLLADAGHSVYNIDRIPFQQDGVIHYTTDVNSEYTTEIIHATSPDAIIHFAADHSVPLSIKDPQSTYTNNVATTIKLLNDCISANIKNFIYSSSSSVYGSAGTINQYTAMRPFVETETPHPLTPYSRSKYMIEQILNDYTTAYDFEHVALRYFNAAGSHKGKLGYKIDPPQHILPILVDKAYTNSTLTINGTDYNTPDGTAVRDYTHVTDIALAHIAALDYLFESNPSTIVNIGSNKPHSLLDITKEIELQTDKYIQSINGPRRNGDMEYTFANISKAEEIFNWSPTHTLSDIVHDEILWYTNTNTKTK